MGSNSRNGLCNHNGLYLWDRGSIQVSNLKRTPSNFILSSGIPGIHYIYTKVQQYSGVNRDAWWLVLPPFQHATPPRFQFKSAASRRGTLCRYVLYHSSPPPFFLRWSCFFTLPAPRKIVFDDDEHHKSLRLDSCFWQPSPGIYYYYFLRSKRAAKWHGRIKYTRYLLVPVIVHTRTRIYEILYGVPGYSRSPLCLLGETEVPILYTWYTIREAGDSRLPAGQLRKKRDVEKKRGFYNLFFFLKHELCGGALPIGR